jgi:hypothetical protein
MKDQETIEAAWEISTLMNKLNDLIWDQYEDAFIDRYMKEQEQKYWEAQVKMDLHSETIEEPV